jgi:hypothetical protein
MTAAEDNTRQTTLRLEANRALPFIRLPLDRLAFNLLPLRYVQGLRRLLDKAKLLSQSEFLSVVSCLLLVRSPKLLRLGFCGLF